MKPRAAIATGALLAAVESRDLRAIEDALSPDATWQNVPGPPNVGREAVMAMLAPIVTWSDEVRWDVVSASYDETTGWLERVDRFVIDGVEHAVQCNGVFDVLDGRVAMVRDYVDIVDWRARIGPVLQELGERSPRDVVARHLAAVERRDTVAMAADYALNAELVRSGTTYRGYRPITDYFDTVPARLAGRQLVLGDPEHVGDAILVPWQIPGRASGTDRYVVQTGRIVRQTVVLDNEDF